MHQDDFQHALKEVDASALAIVKSNQELLNIFKYVITGIYEIIILLNIVIES